MFHHEFNYIIVSPTDKISHALPAFQRKAEEKIKILIIWESYLTQWRERLIKIHGQNLKCRIKYKWGS